MNKPFNEPLVLKAMKKANEFIGENLKGGSSSSDYNREKQDPEDFQKPLSKDKFTKSADEGHPNASAESKNLSYEAGAPAKRGENYTNSSYSETVKRDRGAQLKNP